MRVWKMYLTQNSGILLLLAEWKNGVGRYLERCFVVLSVPEIKNPSLLEPPMK
jgi:hypothetical protein